MTLVHAVAVGPGTLVERSGSSNGDGGPMKGSEKPKKVQKKQPQKTLKERRADKREAAAKKPSSI